MSGTRGGFGRIVAMGIALALALLLLAAKEARAGKYAVAQCGWYVGADAELGRYDRRRQVPPGRLVRAAGRQRPLRRRPPEELHPRRPADGLRHALRPLALGGAGRHRDHPGARHLVARPARRHGAAARGRQLERWLRRLRRRRPAPTPPRASSSPASIPAEPAFEDRLLCARAESKWCSLEPGSWSAIRALTITVEDDQAPAAAIGGDITAGGWRRGAQGVSFWGSDTGGGVRFGETAVDGARVNLTEYGCAKASIGGEWRATQMRPCALGVSGGATDRHHPLQRRPPQHRPLRHRLRRQRRLHARADLLVDNNPPAHPRNLALAGGEGWRREQRLRPLLGQPRPGARRARSAAPPGGSTGRPATTPGSSSRPGTTSRALQNLFVPARRRLLAAASGCATRPATRRRPRRSRCRCASTTCRPGVAFDAPAARATEFRNRSAPSRRRPLGPGRRRDPLPPARQPAVD